MPSIKETKRRIASVDTTRKIMKAMDMVAAAKLQKIKPRLLAIRPFAEEMRCLIRTIDYEDVAESHYIKRREPRNRVYAVITSDRGLCGSHNVNLAEKVLGHMKETGGGRIIAVGLKGYEYFTARGETILRTYPDVSETTFYEDAMRVANHIRFLYQAGEADEVLVAYTRFDSALTHVPVITSILPLSIIPSPRPAAVKRRYDPDARAFLDHLVPLMLNAFLYAALIESSACEQAARIMSMETAVNNASDIISDLTRAFNRKRQAAITQEISEIISSANIIG